MWGLGLKWVPNCNLSQHGNGKCVYILKFSFPFCRLLFLCLLFVAFLAPVLFLVSRVKKSNKKYLKNVPNIHSKTTPGERSWRTRSFTKGTWRTRPFSVPFFLPIFIHLGAPLGLPGAAQGSQRGPRTTQRAKKSKKRGGPRTRLEKRSCQEEPKDLKLTIARHF